MTMRMFGCRAIQRSDQSGAMTRKRQADRAEADRIARKLLQSELPKERILQEVVERAERIGWVLGLPRE
jgi:hypothetical protein